MRFHAADLLTRHEQSWPRSQAEPGQHRPNRKLRVGALCEGQFTSARNASLAEFASDRSNPIRSTIVPIGGAFFAARRRTACRQPIRKAAARNVSRTFEGHDCNRRVILVLIEIRSCSELKSLRLPQTAFKHGDAFTVFGTNDYGPVL